MGLYVLGPFHYFHSLQSLFDTFCRSQVRVLCQIVAELECADTEDSGLCGQCGGKGSEHIMLKMGWKCEESGFSWIQVIGCTFLPFGYHQLVIGELLQVD